jgi:energy-coupling factor transport system ATP-binding protein
MSVRDVADAHPLDLHTAQRRMVAVASLEAMAPEILLLDEPSRDFDQHWLAIFEAWLAVCRKEDQRSGHQPR